MYTKEIRSLIAKTKSLKRLFKATGIDNDISAKGLYQFEDKKTRT